MTGSMVAKTGKQDAEVEDLVALLQEQGKGETKGKPKAKGKTKGKPKAKAKGKIGGRPKLKPKVEIEIEDKPAKPRNRTRAQRIRDRHFPTAEVFETREKFFVPLPHLYRKLLHALRPREWMILTWLMMNSRKEGIAEVSMRRISEDTGLQHANRVPGHLAQLEKLGFIAQCKFDGQHYVAILHPKVATRTLHKLGMLEAHRLEAIHDLLEDTTGPSDDLPALGERG